jgi:hypothetical protein
MIWTIRVPRKRDRTESRSKNFRRNATPGRMYRRASRRRRRHRDRSRVHVRVRPDDPRAVSDTCIGIGSGRAGGQRDDPDQRLPEARNEQRSACRACDERPRRRMYVDPRGKRPLRSVASTGRANRDRVCAGLRGRGADMRAQACAGPQSSARQAVPARRQDRRDARRGAIAADWRGAPRPPRTPAPAGNAHRRRLNDQPVPASPVSFSRPAWMRSTPSSPPRAFLSA